MARRLRAGGEAARSRGSTPAVAQLDVLGRGRRPRATRRRALGAEHHVLRRVLGRDELDHLDAVARRLERGGAQGVGDKVCLAAEQQRRGGARRPSRARRSGAASSWWQHGASTIASAPSLTPAAIASSVAVSQACSETSRSIGSSPLVALRSASPRSAPRRSRVDGDPAHRLDHLRVHVDGRRARRAYPPRGRRRRARGSCTPCRSRRRPRGSFRSQSGSVRSSST